MKLRPNARVQRGRERHCEEPYELRFTACLLGSFGCALITYALFLPPNIISNPRPRQLYWNEPNF